MNDVGMINELLAEMWSGRWSPPGGTLGAALLGSQPGPSDRRLFGRFVRSALRSEGLWWMVLAESLDRVSHGDLSDVVTTWDRWCDGERVFRRSA